jgi:hypothetical protein
MVNTIARASVFRGHILSVLAVACLPLGLLWDISWHISIGRDTFWAPAHIVIQLGGIIPALLFAWQAARTTCRGTPEERGASVCLWGARASFGAWVSMWGALVMLTSAPFDDWWHNTYGLDVKIASPPHALLGLGMFAVALGVMLSVLSWQNRAADSARKTAARLFLLAGGLLVTLLSAYTTEFTWPNRQHSSSFYQVVCCVYPFLFVAIARASKLRWAGTAATLVYTGLLVALVWFLPLFRAQPKLAPIYNPVDHMVPPPFPMLMVVPALAVDLLMRFLGKGRGRRFDEPSPESSDPTLPQVKAGWRTDWLLATAVGLTFLLLTLAVQWFFAELLISPAADNWFFAGVQHWPYYTQPGEWMREFWDLDTNPLTITGLIWAATLAAVSARLGLWCGNWMLKVKR